MLRMNQEVLEIVRLYHLRMVDNDIAELILSFSGHIRRGKTSFSFVIFF